MILTDYLLSTPSIQWDYALQCGARHAVIRLPEDGQFDETNPEHWHTVCERFRSKGITPVVVEPLPNALHDHIKAGDEKRDECVEKAVKMLPIMAKEGIGTLCFNFMAHIGWLRTDKNIEERGGARVTGFSLAGFDEKQYPGSITKEELWKNYEVFIGAMKPAAEKYGIRLALHPDDPPLPRLGQVERIMISYDSIKKALDIADSPNVGVTMCQANFAMMGEDLFRIIPLLREKIFFIHFRNVRGTLEKFNETFHDNGELDMAALLRLYTELNIDVPIRVDHVPLMAGEDNDRPGYTSLGRLFAIGYLKGLLDGTGTEYI